MDGGVRPRFHPLHAGIRSGGHPVQHPGLPHHVLHRTRLCQVSAARGRDTTHRNGGFLRHGGELDSNISKGLPCHHIRPLNHYQSSIRETPC